jgi:DNA polymerase-3 subunit alpha
MFNFEDYEIPNFGYVRLPEINITKEQKEKVGVKENADNFEFLKALCRKGWVEKKPKFNQSKLKKYEEQIKFELDLIKELDFVDYFLLVWLVIDKMRELDAYIDAGRGSCGASLIFYLIGVTGVDPIDKELIFSRFISKVRAKKKVVDGVTYIKGDLAPDVDINIGGVREQVLSWLETIYKGKMSKILNLSTYTGKLLIKDAYKIIENASEQESKEISDLVERNAGIVEDIEDTNNNNEDFKKWADKHEKTYKTALKLRWIIKQKGSHASGYLISYEPLDGNVPIEFNKKKELTVGFTKDDASNFSIKLDLLGLLSDEIINDVVHNIKENVYEIELDNNPIVYDQFQCDKLLPYGLYQISADFAYRVLNQVKPKNIYELSDVNAMARPGAAAYVEDYINNTAPCPHPAFANILKKTRNLCLYQEQMMQMAVAIGFTTEEAELLRRVVGKKKVDEVKEWKDRIYSNCEKNGFDKSIGDILWKILDDSSKYSFNLAHSISTSYITALTVYLKYKYPLQFYLACLKNVEKSPNPIEEIQIIAGELEYFNIKLLAPHLTKSETTFKIEDNNIRFGLSAIKGISDKTMFKVKEFTKEFANKFEIFLAAKQAKLSIGHLSALIQAGCLDDYARGNRSKLVLEAQVWNTLTEKEKPEVIKYAERFNYDLFEIIKFLAKTLNEKGKTTIIRESRLQTIRNKYKPFKEIYDKNNSHQRFADWFYEKTLLGYSYSNTLYKIFQKEVPDLVEIKHLKDGYQEQIVKFVGIVDKSIKKKSANGKNYIKFIVSDEYGNKVNTLVFDNQIEDLELKNDGIIPKENNIVIAKGRMKDGGSLFAWEVLSQDWKIYMKLGELKENKEEI